MQEVKRVDWHSADIKAALNKKGWSFARIAREYGYAVNSPNQVLRSQWASMEEIITRIIGVRPWQIWPSRYNQNGEPLKSKYNIVRVPERLMVRNG